jgi:hypothetical protein
MTHVGGTIPGLVFSSVAYWLAARYLLLGGSPRRASVPASMGGE